MFLTAKGGHFYAAVYRSNDLAVVPLYRLHATFGLSNRVDWSPRVDERIMAWEIGLSGSN